MADTRQDGTFIAVELDAHVASDGQLAEKLTEACPVDIFAVADDGGVQINRDNLDECVLCWLCINAAPQGTVRVIKRYDEGPEAVLQSGPPAVPTG